MCIYLDKNPHLIEIRMKELRYKTAWQLIYTLSITIRFESSVCFSFDVWRNKIGSIFSRFLLYILRKIQ